MAGGSQAEGWLNPAVCAWVRCWLAPFHRLRLSLFVEASKSVYCHWLADILKQVLKLQSREALPTVPGGSSLSWSNRANHSMLILLKEFTPCNTSCSFERASTVNSFSKGKLTGCPIIHIEDFWELEYVFSDFEIIFWPLYHQKNSRKGKFSPNHELNHRNSTKSNSFPWIT